MPAQVSVETTASVTQVIERALWIAHGVFQRGAPISSWVDTIYIMTANGENDGKPIRILPVVSSNFARW